MELGEKGLTDCLRNLTLERIVERYAHAPTPQTQCTGGVRANTASPKHDSDDVASDVK